MNVMRVQARLGKGIRLSRGGSAAIDGGGKAGRTVRSIAAVALVAAPLAFQPPAVANHSAAGTWSSTAGMGTDRSGHTATTITGGIQNGNVLVAGGHDWLEHRYDTCCTSDSLSSAQLFNAGTSAWNPVASMAQQRSHHTATPLGNGRVVVAGGHGDGLGAGLFVANAHPSVEVWNPVPAPLGTWTTHQCAVGRYNHTATLLSDGRVLLVGGQTDGTGAIPSVEVFHPSTGICTATAPMTTDRGYHTATLLSQVVCPNSAVMCDRVLVAGGVNLNGAALRSAEIFTYVPGTANGTWAPASDMGEPRQGHTATLLNDGRVLVAGGMGKPPSSSWDRVSKTAELFTPGPTVGALGSWAYTGNTMQAPSPQQPDANAAVPPQTPANLAGRRYLHTATKLPDGKVLVVGGNDSVNNGDTAAPSPLTDTDIDPGTKTSEVYDPATGQWTAKGSLVGSHGCSGVTVTFTGCRLNHDAALVTVGGAPHVLVTGGASHNTGAYPPFFRELAQHVLASAELYSI